VAACLAPALHAQDHPVTPASHPSDLATTSNLVIVPALVRAPGGDLVPTLRASDFLLTDNGAAQAVSVDVAEHQPLAVVVLMQTGDAAVEQLSSYAKLGTMLSYVTANAPHEVALVEFDSQPEYAWDFTPKVEEIENGFRQPDPGDGGAAILDAVNYGIDLLSKQPPNDRRLILLISQTHDDNSHVRAEEIIRRLGENNITIECLTFSPEKAWLKDQFTKPRHENAPYQLSPALPPVLHTFNLGEPLGVAFRAMRKDTSATVAALSGGESLPFASKAELEQQLAILTNHLAATYTLSFSPSSKQPGFHALQLRIAGHPELQVSARTSYGSSETGAPSK
jgi:VWFA-related protein